MNVVRLSTDYFPDSSNSRALALAYIYVGVPDLDPTVVANQKTLSVQQEDGTIVAVTQPIRTNAGGVPTYLGESVVLLVEGDYSLAVLDSSSVQVYYIPSTAFEQYLIAGNYYYPDYSEADQGVVAVGSDNTITDILTAVGAVTNATMYFSHNSGAATTTYTITTNTAISANYNVVIEEGAIFDGAGTLTFDNPGQISAQPNQLIFGATITIVFSNEGVVYPEWKGAVSDGATDDSAAIDSIFAAVVAGSTVHFAEGPGYGIASAVTCGEDINIDMLSPIIYTGAGNITALTIGTTAVSNQRVKLRLKVQRDTQSDWTSDLNIGVKLFNIYASQVHLDDVRGFTINAMFLGETGGVAYNTVYLNWISNGKYGVDLYAGEAGWVNENLFIGGRFAVSTGVNVTDNRYGVRITSDDDAYGAGYYYNNNNVFIKPSFEMNKTDTTGDATGMLIEYGTHNRVIGCRDEGNDYLAEISNDSAYNIFEPAFGAQEQAGNISDTSTYRNNFEHSNKMHAHEADRGSLIFNSGPIHKKACYYDGATNTNIPGMTVGTSADGVMLSAEDAIVINSEYLSMTTRTVGIFIKTSVKKRFVYRPDVVAGYGGRLNIRAYDSAGVVLTSADASHPYVTGEAFRLFAYNAGYGGVYRIASDSVHDIFFNVGADVDYICLMQSGGTAALRTRGFSVFSVDGGNPAAWTGYEEFVAGTNIGTTSPTEGIDNTFAGWSVGRMIYDAVPASGAQLGWICIRSESTNADGGEPAAEVTWAVDDEQNAADGDILGVELDNGAIHWTSINGAPGAGSIVALAGVPAGRSIADDAKIVWFHFQALANIS